MKNHVTLTAVAQQQLSVLMLAVEVVDENMCIFLLIIIDHLCPFVMVDRKQIFLPRININNERMAINDYS
jgi:hypothetical protein